MFENCLGGMYYPWTWHASNSPNPKQEGLGKFRFSELPKPDKHCQGETQSKAGVPAECKFKIGLAEYFTNRTYRDVELAPGILTICFISVHKLVKKH